MPQVALISTTSVKQPLDSKWQSYGAGKVFSSIIARQLVLNIDGTPTQFYYFVTCGRCVLSNDTISSTLLLRKQIHFSEVWRLRKNRQNCFTGHLY